MCTRINPVLIEITVAQIDGDSVDVLRVIVIATTRKTPAAKLTR